VPRVDVLLVTALQDELEAVLCLGQGGKADWRAHRDRSGFPYHVRELGTERGATLAIAAAWTGEMGEAVAAARATALIGELDPGCLAMCGICAGKRGEVSLGDVIVADRVYSYDHGKLVSLGEGEARELFHDIETYGLEKVWKMDAAFFAREEGWAEGIGMERPIARRTQMRWVLHALVQHESGGAAPKEHPARKERCPDWPKVLAALRHEGLVEVQKGSLVLTEKGREAVLEDELLYPDGLPEEPLLRVHVGAIATGKTVREDPLLFKRLSHHVRKTLGVEMEAAAIGQVAAHFERRAIVVKAVSDHADGDKDDSYRAFACRASAAWLLAFLQRNLEPSGPETRESVLPGGAAEAQMASIAKQLEDAIARRAKLRKANASTAAIEKEILALRRRLREGGILRAGDSLGDGRYLLIEGVGRGGFAHVWKALDRETGTAVAIKVLRSDLAFDKSRKERFFRGARIMAELEHETVVRVLEQKGEDGGYHYFVMEFVPGGDLRQAVLRGDVKGEGALPLILAVGEALAVAHARGVVHRDVKPANIMLDAEGKPRLTDFDLVAAADTTGGTRSGALGTFVYGAPECMHQPQDADPRADVYSLGMTAVFLLYGKELPLEVVRDAKSFIEKLECSAAVKGVLEKAAAWEVGARFGDAGVFCEGLQRALRTLHA
jgi:nucleoside phosphorylase